MEDNHLSASGAVFVTYNFLSSNSTAKIIFLFELFLKEQQKKGRSFARHSLLISMYAFILLSTTFDFN